LVLQYTITINIFSMEQFKYNTQCKNVHKLEFKDIVFFCEIF